MHVNRPWTQLGAYVLIVVLAAVGFWTIGVQQQEITDSQVAACKSSNEARAGERQIWGFFFRVSKASAVSQHQPQAVLDFYDDYLRWIDTQVLPDRDCSDLSKIYPKPGPPPSFKKALAEAEAAEKKNN